MELPSIPPETPSFLWGAVAGAAAAAVIGFNWGGWVTGGTAEKLALDRADKATVTALTPVCVEQFRKGDDAPARLVKLKALQGWEQGDFVGKGGWATMPGSKAEPNGNVASACAEALGKL